MITLSSDFGSPYPAAMKGVLLRRTDAQLVDVTHEFPRQDVRASAFWLREVLPYFPPAVHLVVVDPGVGTDRAAIAIRTGEHALVGPDNGVLVPAARALAGDEFEVFRIVERDDGSTGGDPAESWPPAPASTTFHGRDVFAPAAGHLHSIGVESLADDEGFERVETYEDLTFPDPEVSGSHASGVVLAVDGFGNAITSIPGEAVAGHWDANVRVNDVSATIRRTYADAEPGRRIVTVGSHGNVELAVNRGRGDDSFAVSSGSDVELSW